MSIVGDRLTGKLAARPGLYPLWVKVTDTQGLFALRRLVLRVRP